jgi:hypothetical protein
MANMKLSVFYPVLRALLSDQDPDIHIYDDGVLEDGVTAIVNLGKVRQIGVDGLPGGGDPYAISGTANDEISPDLAPASDPSGYACLIWHTAKVFAVALTASRFSTRGFSEQIGEPKELIANIIQEVYALENGNRCT